MFQAVKDIAETVDNLVHPVKGHKLEIFVIIQQGLNIGFFEYFNAQEDLDERGIEHFKGCVSLTQDIVKYDPATTSPQGLPLDPAVITAKTPGLLKLMFDDEKLETLTNKDAEKLRNDARNYNIPCILDLNVHEKEINLMMKHIRDKDTRE